MIMVISAVSGVVFPVQHMSIAVQTVRGAVFAQSGGGVVLGAVECPVGLVKGGGVAVERAVGSMDRLVATASLRGGMNSRDCPEQEGSGGGSRQQAQASGVVIEFSSVFISSVFIFIRSQALCAGRTGGTGAGPPS